jgi:hypothetical protein
MPVRRVVARLRECKKETVPMLQRVAAIVAAVVIAATFPGLLVAHADHAPAQTSNEATVCIFQPAGSGFGTAGVYLDGDYIGTLHGGRYFCFTLAPGQHSFLGATGRGKFWKGSLTATLAAGRLYYLESSTAYKRFKPIPNRQAFKEQTADSKDLGSSAKVTWVSLPLPAANMNRQAASPAPVTSPPSSAATSVDAEQSVGQKDEAVPANHPDVRAGAGPTASNDATMTSSPTKVVHDYLLAAASTDVSTRKLFLSATCAVDIADEFSANLKSGWTFSETDLSLTNERIDLASGKASVSAQVVYKGGNPPTFMATSHTFFLVQEGGSWKISAINPPPAKGGPGVTPL